MPNFIRLLLLSVLLTGTLSAAPTSWGKLKIGMSAEEAVALLGRPFCRSEGHGYQRWVYDQGAEVLLHGGIAVIGWSVPLPLRAAVRNLDIWSDRASGDYYAALCTARAEQAARRRSGVRAAKPGAVYEDYLAAPIER